MGCCWYMQGWGWAPQGFCSTCGRSVLDPTWTSVGFPNADGYYPSWHRSFWCCAETLEGFTVYCHHCTYTSSLAEAEEAFQTAREAHELWRPAAFNVWQTAENRHVRLQEDRADAIAAWLVGAASGLVNRQTGVVAVLLTTRQSLLLKLRLISRPLLLLLLLRLWL